MEVKNDIWGVLLLRGIIAILFGFAAVFWPGLTLVTLVYLFAAFILINGVITFVMGLTNSLNLGHSTWTRILTVLVGALEVGVGVYLLRHPTVSFGTLVLLIGIVLVVRGVIEVVSAFVDDEAATMKTFTIIGGVLAVLAGLFILFQPVSAGVAFVWVLGLYALIAGPLLIALAVDLKNGGPSAGGAVVKLKK